MSDTTRELRRKIAEPGIFETVVHTRKALVASKRSKSRLGKVALLSDRIF